MVQGTVDGNTDDAGQPLSCAAYAAPGYSQDAYLATYDPAVWGTTQRPSGPLEDARRQSEQNQAARVQIRVGPNTTIVGMGRDARMIGLNLLVQNVDNVIVRNIDFENAFDCFPQWDPNDGSAGNWNSAFDNVSLTGATHVWMDHDSFTDGAVCHKTPRAHLRGSWIPTDPLRGTGYQGIPHRHILGRDKEVILRRPLEVAFDDRRHDIEYGL